MSVPDHRAVVNALFATGHYNLTTHDGLAAFVDACVLALHEQDSRWGHLKKKPGQTQIHGHAEDAALYKKPDGTAQAVDFIGGAGGPNPQPGWLVDSFVYKHADWLDPADHDGAPAPPPSTPSFPYPDEPTAVLNFQKRVKAAYNAVGRQFPDPNDSDAYRHFARYGYDCRGMPEPEAATKHIQGLRAQLGAPPE